MTHLASTETQRWGAPCYCLNRVGVLVPHMASTDDAVAVVLLLLGGGKNLDSPVDL